MALLPCKTIVFGADALLSLPGIICVGNAPSSVKRDLMLCLRILFKDVWLGLPLVRAASTMTW